MRSIRLMTWAGLVGAVLAAPAAFAQDTAETRIEPYAFERNETYEGLIRFKRMDAELIYIDELEGEIPMDGAVLRPPPEEEDTSEASEPLEISSRVILFLAALAILALVWRHRDSLMTLMGRPPSHGPAATAPRAKARATVAQTADLSLIDRLRAMADREAALVMLLEAALDSAAKAHGLRLGRAETAREFLRRLPGNWPYFEALRRLVMAEELVQFGGRALADETFEACVSDAVPILQRARPA